MRKIKEVYTLKEIQNLVYDDKTKKCSFKYKEKEVKGLLLLFRKQIKELLVEKEI